jgi:hypothetical protein
MTNLIHKFLYIYYNPLHVHVSSNILLILGRSNLLNFILLMWRIERAPNSIPIYSYIQQDATSQFIYIWKLLYMFRVVLPLIIRSAYNCIYSILYLSHRYCYLPLSWKSWNRFECAVGGVRQDAVDTVVCAPDNEWKYHPKHVEQFPDINKLCDVASCWIYKYIGLYLRCTYP